MPLSRRRLSGLLGIGLLTLLLLIGVVVARRQLSTFAPQTGQTPPIVVDQVAELPTLDSPLPTVIVEGTIEPTWTPVPTPLPPPTPTMLPGPTATARPLIPPAPDAAGAILYSAAEAEIKPGHAASIAIDVILVDKTGQPQTEPKRLSSDIQVSGISALHASPDGSRILIEDGWGIHSILYTESGKVESPFHKNANPRGTFFSWHPDNKQILIRAEDNYLDPGLWLVNTETGQHITLLALYGTPSNLIGGSVSPDGQKVVYALKRDFEAPSELWVASTNGADHRQLDTLSGYTVALAWSPDGGKIAFLGDGLTVMNADGTEIRSIGKNAVIGYGFLPAWSPDSQMIAYTAFEQVSARDQETTKDSKQIDPFAATDIHLVDVVTGEERKLLNNDSIGNIDSTWSPDGSQLAFVSKRSGASTIWLVNKDGTNLRELSTVNQWIRSLNWVKYQLQPTR